MNRASFVWRRFLFAALICGWVVLAHSQSKKLWQVYAEAGETAFQEYRLSSAEVMLLSAIKEAESEGVHDPWLGKINYELGRLYSTTGYKNHGKAEGHFLAALRMWEQCHEPDTDEIAMCLNALGRSLDSPARQKEAERPYSRAIDIFEKLNDSSNVADVVDNLASSYCAQDKYAEAEKSVKEGLEFIEQSKKADDKTVAYLVDTLVAIHLLQNRIEEAEAAYRRLQTLGEAGKDYANTLKGARRRAAFLYEGKRYPEAERLLKSELALLKKQSALTTLAAANAFDDLADVYSAQDKYAEAEKSVKEGLEFVEQSKKADDKTVASLVDTLLGIHLLQNRIEDAEAAYRRLQSLGEAGKDYAKRLGGALSRAVFLYEAKRYPEAERLLKGELALLKKQSALTTLAAANAVNRLADVHYRQQKFKEAETEKEQSFEIAKKVLGPDIDTDWAQADVAVIQYAQGNARAESLFQESLGSMKKRRAEMKSPEDQQNLGKQIADRLEHLAERYGGEGKNEQSASLYKEALEIREKDIGQDDPGTIAATKAYIELLRKLKRDAEAHELEAQLRQTSK
jgi:hypothetical protein